MNNNIISYLIYFWAFIIGVIIFGKLSGVMNDPKTTVIILIAAALIFVVWVVGRSKARQKREQRQWEQEQNTKIHKGNKRR